MTHPRQKHDPDQIVPEQAGSSPWRTRATIRTILVAVHTVTTAARLLDIVVLLAPDHRIQLVYTRVPDRLGDGVDRLLWDLEGKVVPWAHAKHMPFDLVVSASLHELGSLRAPRLAVPHGAGFGKLWPSWAYNGREMPRPTYGLDAASLLDHNGQVTVDALILSHPNQLTTLERQCPKAVSRAVLAGDPCYDRLLASLPFRELYRHALGIRPGQTLVAVASTWGRNSLFATGEDLLHRLMGELPASHRVIAMLHSAIWYAHGPWQVAAWLSEVRGAGLDLIVPGGDWRGLLVAADLLISDHTSVSAYASAIGLPVLLTHFPAEDIDPGSAIAAVAAVSPRLCPRTSLLAQFEAARRARPVQRRLASQLVSSQPGRSAEILRRTMYGLLDLPEPLEPARVTLAPPPRLVAYEGGAAFA